MKKVVVIGLDGLEPKIVESMLEAGDLPNLGRLRAQGGCSTVATTNPAQTPVAWASFATGTNPGGHGVFDFIRRDPKTYLPDLSLTRYEQKSPYLPPKVLNLRGGTPFWQLLSAAGIPSVILRCPCTYPPDAVKGRMLAGVGVPDLRGGMGTATFYTSTPVAAKEAEHVVVVLPDQDATIRTAIIGPRNPKTAGDCEARITIEPQAPARKIVIHSDGEPRALEVREGEWSDWLRVKFKIGLLQSVRGMVRFHLVSLLPTFQLYGSPVNFDPDAPPFPISAPPEYARQMAAAIGPFHTSGMAEEHRGLNNGRFEEEAYLAQCQDVLRERERMMLHELERFREGFFFCLFDTPDRLQHMFWRFGESGHPANSSNGARDDLRQVIPEHYRACDALVGKALQAADEDTLFVVLSDHGMNSFQRGVHLNTWLHANGLLALRAGSRPGDEAGDFLRAVDWTGTRAYALGLGGIYLNLKGREERGIVPADDAAPVKRAIAESLAGLGDPDRGRVAIRSVQRREQVYAGPYVEAAPDLLVNFADGYRASWGTTLGGVPAGLFEDNTKRWGGDHIIDPALVPGVLLMNRPFRIERPAIVDLAPTILSAFGLQKGHAMEGRSLVS